MKLYRWDEEKNAKLKRDRGIGFEAVIEAIKSARVVDDYEHPNETKYPHQRIMVVIIENYGYIVPYIENETEMIFKTLIPSRKATKKYLKKVKGGIV